MTKAKIKTNRQLVQYQKEQLARKDAKIAALERKVERMTKQFEKERLDDAKIAALERKVERMTKQFEKERLDFQDWLTRS